MYYVPYNSKNQLKNGVEKKEIKLNITSPPASYGSELINYSNSFPSFESNNGKITYTFMPIFQHTLSSFRDEKTITNPNEVALANGFIKQDSTNYILPNFGCKNFVSRPINHIKDEFSTEKTTLPSLKAIGIHPEKFPLSQYTISNTNITTEANHFQEWQNNQTSNLGNRNYQFANNSFSNDSNENFCKKANTAFFYVSNDYYNSNKFIAFQQNNKKNICEVEKMNTKSKNGFFLDKTESLIIKDKLVTNSEQKIIKERLKCFEKRNDYNKIQKNYNTLNKRNYKSTLIEFPSKECGNQNLNIHKAMKNKFDHKFTAENAFEELILTTKVQLREIINAIHSPISCTKLSNDSRIFDQKVISFDEIVLNGGKKYLAKLRLQGDCRKLDHIDWISSVVKSRAELSGKKVDIISRTKQWLKWWWTCIALTDYECQILKIEKNKNKNENSFQVEKTNENFTNSIDIEMKELRRLQTQVCEQWVKEFKVTKSVVNARVRQCDRVFELQEKCGWPAFVLASLAEPQIGRSSRHRKSHLERSIDATQISTEHWNKFLKLAVKNIKDLKLEIENSLGGYEKIKRILELSAEVHNNKLNGLKMFE